MPNLQTPTCVAPCDDKGQNFWDAENVAFTNGSYQPNAANPAVQARGFYVGTTGAVQVQTESGNVVTFSSIPAGTTIWCAFKLMLQAGTTASNIVALA